jgi:hypothetical protein
MTHAELKNLDTNSYFHKHDHRNKSPKKSQWTITEDEEKICFENSLLSKWNEEHLSWGLHFNEKKVQYLGKSAEFESVSCDLFIAKFIDGDKNKQWHGYPANPNGKKPQDIPPVNVLNDWLKNEYLRRATIRKITKGQKCSL